MFHGLRKGKKIQAAEKSREYDNSLACVIILKAYNETPLLHISVSKQFAVQRKHLLAGLDSLSKIQVSSAQLF